MKMKVSRFITFALLSITILSFGLTSPVNAQSQTVQDGLTLPLSVSTELPTYSNGDSIIISGFVKVSLIFYVYEIFVKKRKIRP